MREDGGVTEAATTVSERESEVLLCVADHLTNAQIGERLHISVRTVESHVSSLLRKLGVADRRALARYARGLAGAAPVDDAGAAPRLGGVATITGLTTVPAPGNGHARRPGALMGGPAALTSFVGRREELDAVADALASARLVNLVGPGGVGKTRLAVEAGTRAAARHPGGAWFVDLVPVRGDGVATAVAAALGLGDRPNSSLVDVIEDALRDDHALLVLDNCEHVLEEAASLTERLLVACPGLRVMATSRELLGVTGERVVPVAPLAEADAVTLFVERAAPSTRPSAPARPATAGARPPDRPRPGRRHRRPRGPRRAGGRSVCPARRHPAGHRAGVGPLRGAGPRRRAGRAHRPAAAAGRPPARRPPPVAAQRPRLEPRPARSTPSASCCGGWPSSPATSPPRTPPRW